MTNKTNIIQMFTYYFDYFMIFVNNGHLRKALNPILVLEEIVACFKDEQSEKAKNSISVTEEGIVICVNDEQ